ncbi:MAG: hypothetical protein JOZ24_07230 [Candidatus Eremiobacteraeota bacterium]|nr:hypothetical protein [Candidatus Eremiobacteraeota bacterium]
MPAALLTTQSVVSAASDVPGYLHAALGPTTQASAKARGLATPDLATVIACYPELAQAFNQSVNPSTDKSSDVKATPPIDTLQTAPLSFDASCAGH